MVSGIPQSGERLGNPNAPVTMTWFGDVECPLCTTFAFQSGFPELVARDVRFGRVQVIYRGFQTATPSSRLFETQSIAALAAGEQSRYWQFVLLFLDEQQTEGTNYVTEGFLDSLAKQIPGLALARWKQARRSGELAEQVRVDERLGEHEGVLGTPTLIVKGPDGTARSTDPIASYRELEKAIRSVE
jgi:protein-disulfide isomerase